MKQSEIVHDLTMFALKIRVENDSHCKSLLLSSVNKGLQNLCSLYADIHEKIVYQSSLYNLTAVEKDL